MTKKYGWELVIPLVISIAITVIAVSYSITKGKLAFPPWYDDSHSMVEGALRLMTYQAQGIHGAYEEYMQRFPHSFLHYYWASLVFGIAGIHDSTVYWANVVFVLLALTAVWMLIRDYGLFGSTFLTAAFAGVPVIFNVVYDFRSECALAPILFAGCIAVVLALVSYKKAWYYIIVSGILFAVGFGIKPAMFPYTFGMMGGACLVWMLFLRKKSFKAMSFTEKLNARFLPAIGLLFIGVTPFFFHYWIYRKQILGYIIFNGFQNEFYKQPSGLLGQLSYHLIGFPAMLNLGGFKWYLLTLSVLGVMGATVFLRQDSASLKIKIYAVAVLMGISYFGIAVNHMVQNYFCMTFDLLLSASACLGVVWIASLLPPKLKVIPPLLIFTIVIVTWRVPVSQDYLGETTKQGKGAVEWRQKAPGLIFDKILSEAYGQDHPKIWVGAHGWVDGNTLSWEAIKRGLKWKAFSYYEQSPSLKNEPPKDMDFIVLYPPETMGISDLPLNKDIIAMIRRTGEIHETWRLFSEVADPEGNKVLLYKKLHY
jgi:hypothetical protein